MTKIRVGVIFGGKSAEHEVSLASAKNVIDALDKTKYEPVLIGIDKRGVWYLQSGANYLLHSDKIQTISLSDFTKEVTVIPHPDKSLVELDNNKPQDIDVFFPVLHGTYGEDGTVQGLLKLSNIPFVGASVLGSAIGMDKDVMKRLLNAAGIPTAKFMAVRKSELKGVTFESVKKALGLPFFIKPANLGSSIGVNKVHDKAEFKPSLENSLLFDNKILAEEYIQCREIEVSVLGNDEPEASLPGEVIPTHEFYSYDAKYIDENGATFKIPADLPKPLIKQIQDMAIATFKILECSGMARVDFFLTEKGKLYVNEINTIPGFTNISMYPKLWEVSGLPQKKLIDRLITLAIEKFEEEKKLKTSI